MTSTSGATSAATSSPPSPARIAVVGGLSMAAAMGIGRFAFTPLLPLMQAAQGLLLSQGAWLAVINYLGYLLGAIVAFVWPPRPGAAVRWGATWVAIGTFGMAISHGIVVWLALRFIAGVASAFVMMGVAGWALALLSRAGRSELGGWIFGSVGTSIAVAGGIAFVAAATGGDPRPAWAALGLAAAAIAAWTWRPLTFEPPGHPTAASAAPPLDRETWILIVCYGVAGFGYIVPATFLPAVARALVDDPHVFGWVWPVFGLAAAIATIGVAILLPRAAPRTVCAVGMLVMAAGNAVPVLHLSVPTLIVSAVCIGGTFILVTLAGLNEARRLAHASPARAVAGMTASFALGQLVGPLLSHAGGSALTAMRLPSTIATVALVISALVLLMRRPSMDAAVGSR